MNIFIIGNGVSRQKYDLEKLRSRGKIFGCNALFRNFRPDYLVAIDQRMMNEIMAAGYTDNVYFLGFHHQFDRKIYHEILKDDPLDLATDISGTTALNLSLKLFPETKNVFILGFDDLWDKGKHAKYNNIFKGTKNYGGRKAKPIPSQKSIVQICKTATAHPGVRFYRVGDDNPVIHSKFSECPNIQFISYENMERLF